MERRGIYVPANFEDRTWILNCINLLEQYSGVENETGERGTLVKIAHKTLLMDILLNIYEDYKKGGVGTFYIRCCKESKTNCQRRGKADKSNPLNSLKIKNV